MRKGLCRFLGANTAKVMLLAMVFLIAGGLSLQAQDLGSISGTITDPSGAAMPGVTVTLTNQLRNTVVRTAVSNSAGVYVFPDLPASTYSLRASKNGFTSSLHSDVIINVRSQVRVDFQLAVGAVTQQVTVTAPSVHLQTENGAESQEITGKHVAEIDINGRNFIQLATLVPGASGGGLVGSLNVPVGVTANAGINFNGERQAHNVFSVDGQENYDRGCGGCIEIVPDQDAIAQFNVLTSSASSDVGAGSGGNVQLILKSGTSQYHGEVFEFNRNTSFDAGDFFSNSANKPKAKLDINNFGFNLGGPIALPGHAKKTFFFTELDWRKWIQGNTYTPNAPLAAWTQGNFGAASPVILDKTKPVPCATGTCYQPFPNNVIPTGMLDKNALLLAQPNFIFNSANNPNGSAQFIGSASAPINVNEQIVRIDHQFSDKTSLMMHYVRDGIDQNFPTSLWSSDSYPTVGTDFLNEPQSILLKLTRSVSPTLLNEFMIGFNRQPLTLLPIGHFAQPSGLSITRLFPNTPNADNRIPTISFAGPLNTAYDIASWPWTNVLNTWTIRDSATKISGNHAFNFGVYYLHYLKEQQLFGNTNGNFNFNSQNATLGTAGSYIDPSTGAVTKTNGNSFADFMLGNAYTYTQLQVQTLPSAINTFFQPWFGDTWKAKSNLTLNYGIRWDYMPHAHERHNQVAVFRESLFNFADAPQIDSSGHFVAGTGVLTNVNGSQEYLNGMGIAGQNGIPTILVDNHWTNFEPRFGFAWQPHPDSKTVVRGGFGIFFENIQGNDIYNVQPNPPFSNSPQLLNTSLDNPGGGTAVLSPSGLTSYDPSYLQPYSEQWNLGVQEQINSKTVASISYVGSKSTHQQITRNINQPTAPVTAGNLNQFRPYLGWGSINWYENSTNSNYNSLQASLRFSDWHGLTSGASYTYSHCLDYSDNDNGGAINDAYNLAAEYGTCGYDIRHMLVVNYVYSLPIFNTATGAKRVMLGGWQLSGITTIYSGNPLTIGSSVDSAHCGCGGYRADLVGNANNGPRTPAEWFNTAAFVTPANDTFGDAARNIVDGAGIDNFDVSLFKNFAGIPFPGNKEGATMQLRFEFFNFFNTTQFTGFSTTVGSGNFGQATSARLPRELQVGAQFIF